MNKRVTLGVAAVVVAGAAVVGVLVRRHPAAPELNTPADGVVLPNGDSDTGKPIIWEFTWSKVPKAERYEFVIDHPGAPAPLIDKVVEEPRYRYMEHGTSYKEDDLTRWSWKARAQVGGR